MSQRQLQKELTVPTPLTRETACINPSIFECVCFPKAYNWIKGYFIPQGKGKSLTEAGEKKKKKSAWLCRWQEDGLTPAQTHCKLMTWFHPPEPPTVTPVGNAAARPSAMPARLFTQPHWESDLALPSKTKTAKHVVVIVVPAAFAFLSQTPSPPWVTGELYGCSGTTERGVHASAGWKHGIWIHLVKTQLKPVLPARDRFI